MADHADFLVEIGTEELPPVALPTLCAAFRDGIAAGLDAARLAHGGLRAFASPRRLAVLVTALATRQPPSEIEKRGPPVKVAFDADGRPTKAADAFARGCGVSVDALDRVSTPKGEWLVYRAADPGRDAAELLPGIVDGALASLPIPRRMRWGAGEVEFVRPVHWLVLLLDGEVLPATLLGKAAGRETRGHRFHAPEPIALAAAADYPTVLAERGRVLADFDARRERVIELARESATAAGGEALLDPAVVTEVTALVEWPVAVTGRFDAEFLALPREVLISTLQSHQRYFPVQGGDGKLLPLFIAISNLESREPAKVAAGNERVVRPRLADAKFFWNKDRQQRLADRVDALKQVVFQRDLGSLYDKSARVGRLARWLAESLPTGAGDAALATQLARAAQLAKTDLLTEMVGEFPELQGRMGYYYALADGEDPAVATAIEEQYLPRHAGDRLPATPAGRLLSLAERLDTLAGIFATGRRPTGNRDPFGLRRAALGLLRIAIEGELELDLPAALRQAVSLQPLDVDDPDALVAELYEFIVDRLRAWYLEGQLPGVDAEQASAEMFAAVRARRPASPVDFRQRLLAVHEFMTLDAAASLAAANKRIANILKGAPDGADEVDPALLREPAEQALYAALQALADAHARQLAARDYRALLTGLAGLREAVDRFFDEVLVMAEDERLRRNRLALLRRLRRLFLDVADLSLVPVAEGR
ncbi:MAG: glycine--tRNA ligase subunit beta [Gammaproteobacteria bacterium]|nr:MAG: glycine--tRNA ligase subunit beta [Gammaproteobacteria bacterium]